MVKSDPPLVASIIGFSAARPLYKRKFDLTNSIRELLQQRIISFGRGQTDPKDLFLKRGKGTYVVVFYAGDNDVEANHTPQQIADDFTAFERKVHAALPATQIVFIPIKPSVRRWPWIERHPS